MLPFGSCNVCGGGLAVPEYGKATSTNQFAGHTDGQQTLHEPNGSITTAQDTPDDGPKKAQNM
jgi:hypothetical protein